MSTSDHRSDEKSHGSLWGWPFHTLLLTAVPILSLFVQNFDEVAPSDLWLPLVVALCASLTLLTILRFARGCWQSAGVVVSISVVMFFFFRQGHRLLFIASHLVGLPVLKFGPYTAIWGLSLLGALALLVILPKELPRTTKVLNVFALVLLAIVIGNSVRPIAHHIQARRAAAAATQLEPVELTLSEDSPDIYYLVFDRYAGLNTLQTDFGYDNQPFYNQLRERGFFCAPRSRANYPRTKISMASALNMRLLSDPIYEDHVKLIRNHRVGENLNSVGYQYFHLGNWYGPVRRSRWADETWPVSAYSSYFAEELCRGTPVVLANQLLRGERVSHLQCLSSPNQIEGKFARIEELAHSPEKKFVYAHFLLPHPPFQFNHDGTLVTPEQLAARTTEENYVEQLRYTNSRIIELVDNILARSRKPPVIILQADEGPVLTPADATKSNTAKMNKRTGILSAFYLPDRDAEALLTDEATPVNTFRMVFSEYFDADLPSLPNRVFYWDPADAKGMPSPSGTVSVVDVTEVLRDDRQTIAAAPPKDASPADAADSH